MRETSNGRNRSANPALRHVSEPVTAVEVRGERFEIAPEPGYKATVILLAEYRAWLGGLKDHAALARITYNVSKLARGLMGDWKEVGGVYEMRVDYGPGYRIYFGKHGKTVFLVAFGGDKSSQQADIATAAAIWSEVKHGIKEIRG